MKKKQTKKKTQKNSSFRKLGSILLLVFLLQLQFISAVEPFRFALLTDLHITQGTTALTDLENSVDQINSTPYIDFVLVTGDITEIGDRASLQKAKTALDKLNVKYYITSGNHETKWSASGCTDFGEIFGSNRFAFEHKGVHFYGFNTGPVLRMADGHVSPQDITWLKNELRLISKSDPVILATHYPLQYGDVDNWYELTDAVRMYNIRAILGGHYHRNALFAYDGIPGIINRSNLRAKADVGGYSIYSVTPDSLIVYEQTIGGIPKRWATLSMTERYYNEKGSQTKYPDSSVNKLFPQIKENWIVRTGIGIYSSPVRWKNNVYVGDDMGNLICYSLKNGKKIWGFKSGNRIVGTPAIAEGILVFGSADRNIYGLDSKNGKLRWKITAKEPVLGAVSINNGIAYIGASDHSFRAIEIKTGKEIWQFTRLNDYVETKPLIVSNKVIFGAWDTYLYALNKESGQLLWKWTNGIKSTHYSPAAVWPVAANGKVFIVDPERAMTAINIETGKTIWRTKQSMVRESIGISEDGNRIYAKTMQDSVVCYSSNETQPREIWSVNVAFGYEHNPSMLMEKDGVVYGSTKNGLIFALDALTGNILWKHKIGNSLINTVLPLDKKRVLITAASGEVGILTAP
ncbi:MAG: outer membrane protein assembly factor BamB family protein [Paludibacteraceae bacterium]